MCINNVSNSIKNKQKKKKNVNIFAIDRFVQALYIQFKYLVHLVQMSYIHYENVIYIYWAFMHVSTIFLMKNKS